ncbi:MULTISPECIES: DnaB-like helicase C-terminal domain-containing protein [unclassified Streptomyces]|uniref:replicative DNA helicase n=1 Tax=unclassified Streptomyces TaxID=2593676 RepID=UPI000DD7CD3C|nr:MULTISPECIES: DnaB-like helicase C-terminal domain-containing protein [unclassified Streptomyces]QZZ26565.1 AAA family ATPase [Streptomyces sp. ST1015]
MTDLHDEPPTDDFTAVPPVNLDAEQAVIGGMLLAPIGIADAERVIGALPVFYALRNEIIYRAILDLHGAPGVRPDPITVADHLKRNGDLDKIGGAPYLHHCVQAIPTAANTEWYADIVVRLYRLRRLLAIGTEAASGARIAEAEPEVILDKAMTDLQALLAEAAGGDAEDSLSVADNWADFVEELSAGNDPDAIDSPWKDLNEVVQLKPKELIVVGAATGGGKSLLGMNMAAHVALRRGKPVLFASMEMTRKELLARLTAAEAGVKLDHLVRRKLTDDDWARIARVSDRLQNADKFILDDSPALTVAKIRARVRWMSSQNTAPGLVVVDYMQLITPESTKGGDANRAQEVAKISRGLKLIADEYAVPVIALAQFNRSAVGRKPLVTDFKDSSQIEQDASVILLLHRELAADGSDTGPTAGHVTLIVGKNRNGGQGREIVLQFQGEFGRLRSIAPPSWSPTASLGGAA